jgi:putative lipoic acid-binding regulatory protein
MFSDYAMSQFRDLLDQNYNWPCPYQFKFIVPKGNLGKVFEILPKEHCLLRPSKTGKYVSVTYSQVMKSSSEVIKLYEEVKEVDQVIVL